MSAVSALVTPGARGSGGTLGRMLHPPWSLRSVTVAGRGAQPDPVSVAFYPAARRLLERAYAQRRTWVDVWLPDPTIRQRTRWAGEGIADLTGPDPVPRGGGVNAQTRWARAFIRALYYQHKWNSPRRAGGAWERRSAPRATNALRV